LGHEFYVFRYKGKTIQWCSPEQRDRSLWAVECVDDIHQNHTPVSLVKHTCCEADQMKKNHFQMIFTVQLTSVSNTSSNVKLENKLYKLSKFNAISTSIAPNSSKKALDELAQLVAQFTACSLRGFIVVMNRLSCVHLPASNEPKVWASRATLNVETEDVSHSPQTQQLNHCYRARCIEDALRIPDAYQRWCTEPKPVYSSCLEFSQIAREFERILREFPTWWIIPRQTFGLPGLSNLRLS
jgi:hypothetical protein